VGTTLYLQDQSARFIVTISFLLLVLCAVGGTLGGLVSYLTQKPSASWARIFIGLITGFVLYWAFLFGAVHLSSFSHGFLFNPFVAMVLSIIGGWIGTNVFTMYSSHSASNGEFKLPCGKSWMAKLPQATKIRKLMMFVIEFASLNAHF
jgi:hypothetical protein